MTEQSRLTPPPASYDEAAEAAALQAAAKRSRRSFLITGALGLAGLAGWRWLDSRPTVEGIPGPLRKVLDFNADLTNAYYKNTRLAPEFARSRARKIRVNGKVGLSNGFDPQTWKLTVQAYAPVGTSPQVHTFTIEQIKALPRTEMTTEFKCIEGWSTIVHWAGVRLSDFLAKYPLATRSGQRIADPHNPPADAAAYVGMTTPNDGYYVGLEMQSALHPQTLLCYEMNGQPLSLAHGAPLRLVSPLKYGVKHIKRIGTIAFTDVRPKDYWAELGYDWHAGH
ncbi:molybdopterin-dependent oxidoreductase [Hymenobacter terrenus]|uniref:molybdopterin-dependent oxidoreductase n=1 Tax=Hymenobacter terrenus TaxID=1629124 RepID=UPI0006193CB1|nr:molybdopterin-dependent oxidoreductase [Hymenobacter terrenus]